MVSVRSWELKGKEGEAQAGNSQEVLRKLGHAQSLVAVANLATTWLFILFAAISAPESTTTLADCDHMKWRVIHLLS